MKRALLGGATVTAVVLLLTGCAKVYDEAESEPVAPAGPMPIHEAMGWTGLLVCIAGVICGVAARIQAENDNPNYVYLARTGASLGVLAFVLWIAAIWVAVLPH